MEEKESITQCHNKMIEALSYLADNQWRISRGLEAQYDGAFIDSCKINE